jgi:predicted nuclease of predicted toxin-antitoxin system
VKFLLDQGLPRGAAAELRARGFDAVHAGEEALSTATDRELIEHARREGRAIVTLDADFHTALALSNAASPSVVRVRIQGLRAIELAALVERVFTLCNEDLRAGAMVTVDDRSVRVRLLPLVK